MGTRNRSTILVDASGKSYGVRGVALAVAALALHPGCSGRLGGRESAEVSQPIVNGVVASPTVCYAASTDDYCTVHLSWQGEDPAPLSYNQIWSGGTMVACRKGSHGESIQVHVGPPVQLSVFPSSSCNPINKGPTSRGSADVFGQVGTPLSNTPEVCSLAPGACSCTTQASWSFPFSPSLWNKSTNQLLASSSPANLSNVQASGTALQLRNSSGSEIYDERVLVASHTDSEIAAGRLKVTPQVCEIPPGQSLCSTRIRWNVPSPTGPLCLYVKTSTALSPVSCSPKDDVVLPWIQAPGYQFQLRYGTVTTPGAFIDAKYVAAVPGQSVPAGDTPIVGNAATGTREITGRVMPSSSPLKSQSFAFSWDGRISVIPYVIFVDYSVNPAKAYYAWVARLYRPEASNGGNPAAVDLDGDSPALSSPFILDTETFTATTQLMTQYSNMGWGGVSALGVNNLQLHGRLHLSLSQSPMDTIANGNPYRSDAGGSPSSTGAYETYKVVITATGTPAGMPSAPVTLKQMKMSIVVANPRTATAQIIAVGVDQPAAPLLANGSQMVALEPSATADGRLIVFQGNPASTPVNQQIGSIMYTFNTDPNLGASSWSPPHSLAQIYYDWGPGHTGGEVLLPDFATSRPFSQVYPIARHPLRDGDGRVFGRTDYIPGAYPWITLDGTDALFSTMTIFNGPSRAGTVVVGAHTEGQLVHVDTSMNPWRGNVSDTYTWWWDGDTSPNSTPQGIALEHGYDQVQVAGSALGVESAQKSMLPVVAQFGSNWLPSRRNRDMVSPSNPYDESLGVLVMPGRYVEVPLERPEYDLLVRLPMNEMLNIDPVLANQPQNEGINRGSTVTFDPRRTADLSGNFNTGMLYGAKFPFERNNAVATAAGCFNGGTCTIADAIDGAVGNSIYFGTNAVMGFTLAPRSKYTEIRDRQEFSISMFFKAGTGASRNYILAFLPVVSKVTYESGTLRVFLYGPTSGQPQEIEDVSLPALGDGKWHHVSVTYGGWMLSVYADGVLQRQVTKGTRVFSDPMADQYAFPHGQIGPPVQGTFHADELYVHTRTLAPAEVKRLAWIKSDPGIDPTLVPLEIPPNTYDGLKFQTGTYNASAAQLGARLFGDTILSYNNTKKCSNCHKAANAFADTVAFSIGVNNTATRRNTPSIVNRVFSLAQFLDGRAASLETQVLHPITAVGELGHRETNNQLDDLETVITRLNQSSVYVSRFQTVYGGPATLARVSDALANYVRSIVAQPSLFDNGTLNTTQELGFRIFSSKGNCATCHSGRNFTDEKFHDIGLPSSCTKADDGRSVATNSLADLYEFRTPSLRNVARTPPYFHDGSKTTLAQVVDFYNDGGVDQRRGKSIHVRPLRLDTNEKAALVAFLQSLNSTGTTQWPTGISSAPPMP